MDDPEGKRNVNGLTLLFIIIGVVAVVIVALALLGPAIGNVYSRDLVAL